MGKKQNLKKDKMRLERLYEEGITMQFFLTQYLGVRDKHFLSGNITHTDIKTLFPRLVRTSFEYAVNNADKIYSGDLLLVIDSLGRAVPYINPNYVYEEKDYFGEYIKEEFKEEIPDINDFDLLTLSNYELEHLLHIYSKYNLRGAYRRVHDELVSRKNSHHASNESKERSLRKERKNEKIDY